MIVTPYLTMLKVICVNEPGFIHYTQESLSILRQIAFVFIKKRGNIIK